MSPVTPPGRAPSRIAAFGWFGVLAVIAASGALYATLPPSPDQWFLGYTGWMLAKGAVPYSGFADGNWPACHWLHALSVLLFGNTPYTWRAFDFGIMLTCTIFASSTARSLWGSRAAVWLLLLYPALYVATGYWYAGERDFVGAHLLFVALWFYWTGLSRRRAAWQLGTGALIALAALVKPTFSLLGPFLALHCLFAVSGEQVKVREKAVHVAVAGGSSLLGLLAGFAVLRLEGASLTGFWDLAVRSVMVRYGNDARTTAELLGGAARIVVALWHWIFAGAAAALALNLLRREPDRLARNLLFPTLWLTGLASYLLQAQGLGYTLGALYAATVPILCSGLGLVSLGARRSRWRAVLALALVLAPIAGAAKKWAGEYASTFGWLAGRISREAHYSRFEAGDGISAAAAMALAAELKQTVPEGGTILVWGRANAINFLAERPQPTRFHHNVTIARRYLPEPFATEWNALFRAEVQARGPAACLVDLRELGGPPPLPTSVRFLKEYLESDYVFIRRVGEDGLFRRKAKGETQRPATARSAAERP
jgi:hypothetical protein